MNDGPKRGFRHLLDGAASAGGVIGSILLFPMKMVFAPFEAALRGLRNIETDVEHSGEEVRSRWKMTLWGILSLPLLLFKSPFILIGRIAARGRFELLFALPAILMLGFLGYVAYQVFANGKSIENRYRKNGYLALQNQDFPVAKTYFRRLQQDGELNDRDQLNWVTILANTGEPELALELLNKLAPDDAKGFAAAHQLKALNLVGQIRNAATPLALRKLKFHLEQTDSNSIQIQEAWARYYLAIDQTDKAIGYFRAAASKNPAFYILIADINERKNRRIPRDAALESAERVYRKMVMDDPLNTQNRISLAAIFTRQLKYEEAEQTLLTGLKIQPEPNIKRALSAFYVRRQKIASAEGEGFAKQFAYLQNALSLDANYPPAYQSLLSLYQKQPTAEDALAVKEQMLQTVTGDTPSPMAHFALSNVLWMEGEKQKAEWHLEQAYRIDPSFVVVINNLAWMLAKKEEPDLDRARKLAETAIAQVPQDARFLDTYGTVLMLQKEYKDAITQFQKALPRSNVNEKIHAKLAICYENIGQDDLAEMHRKNALSKRN